MEFSMYLVWEKKHCGFDGTEDRSHIIFSAQSLSELFVFMVGYWLMMIIYLVITI